MDTLNSNEIRKLFLDFFESKNHLIHPPSSLIPSNDPTLLLTNSGMAQFKSYFSGESTPPNKRITTSQKCFRTTDIDEVGDSTHLTLFEMLGNFSFGDYFKKEACKWALELMTDHLGFNSNKIFITVHNDDKDAAVIWEDIGIPKNRIYFFGDEDNWWGPAGDEGPCGPCSELHYYIGSENPKKFAELSKLKTWGPNVSKDFVELYNLVFTQYYHQLDGSRTELPNKNIDTGMGLERVATILQNKSSVYETDLFYPLIKLIEKHGDVKWGGSRNHDKAIAVLAEHSRSSTFLIADGVIPENTGRGYILRRLIRKAMRYGSIINLPQDFLINLSQEVIRIMGPSYQELKENKDFIKNVLKNECESFSKTLKAGSETLEAFLKDRKKLQDKINEISKRNTDDKEFLADMVISSLGKQGILSDLLKKEIELDKSIGLAQQESSLLMRKNIISTNWKSELSYLEASYLHDTLGFPFEVTAEFCAQSKMKVDIEKFDNLMDKLQSLSKSSSDFGGDKSLNKLVSGLNIEKTNFSGHASISSEGLILAIIDIETMRPLKSLSSTKEVDIILNTSPFYPEGGGQVGDQGVIKNSNAEIIVLDTQSPVEGFIFHRSKLLNGSISITDQVKSTVNIDLRNGSKRNHTGTHMLHAALREILGTHVHQQGSLVSPTRLRFDFTHMKKLSDDEIDSIENLINSKIRSNIEVKKHETTYSDAIKQGAIAFFGDKYSKDVRTVEISNGRKFSFELCGGTHCEKTGEIGSFYIVSESSISSGVRRIEAVTGTNADQFAKQQFKIIKQLALDLGVGKDEISKKVTQMNDQIKSLNKKITSGEDTLISQITTKLLKKVEIINNVNCVLSEVSSKNLQELRKIIDLIRSQLDGIVALASQIDGKAVILVSVSNSLLGRYQASDIVKSISKTLNGGGGGKKDLAQAGGTETAKLGQALKEIRIFIRNES